MQFMLVTEVQPGPFLGKYKREKYDKIILIQKVFACGMLRTETVTAIAIANSSFHKYFKPAV